MVPNHYFVATFPLPLVCVNFLWRADAATHILSGRRQMPAPEMGAWFQGQHLDHWLGCIPLCACGYTMPPGDILWLVCDRVGRSVLSPWQPFFPLILIHLLSRMQYFGNFSHLISDHRADEGLALNMILFFPGCPKLLFSCWKCSQMLHTVECSSLKGHSGYSAKLFWMLSGMPWTSWKSGGSQVVGEVAAWPGFFLE